MKYRDILGFSEKQPKKKVVKEQKKSSVVEGIKQELNEWTDETFKKMPKRWGKPYGETLTEFEKQGGKDTVNEGPAYEYAGAAKKVEKLYKAYWDSVKDFSNLLIKKGLKKEGDMFIRSYTKQVKKWNDFFIRQVRKLL
tara:strand:+ start:158 stop:574 length:417 start_codon:yes stop_codon:yes gene_type:complete